MALAPPPVFRSNFINPRFKTNIHIFINENDVVPRLSLHNVAKLMTLVRMIDKIKSSLFEMVQILTNKKEPDQKYIDAINEVEQDEFQRLDHPGEKNEPYRSSKVRLLYIIFSAKKHMLSQMVEVLFLSKSASGNLNLNKKASLSFIFCQILVPETAKP